IESSHKDVVDLVEDYGGSLESFPYLLVLDAAGKVVHRQPTAPLVDVVKGQYDPAKVMKFLKKSAPPRDAEAMLTTALAAATSQGKRVFLHVGTPWSDSGYYSNILDDFLARPDIRDVLARDYVDLNVHADRATGSNDLLVRFDGYRKGVPWI